MWAGGYFQEQETLELDLTQDWDFVEAEDGSRHSFWKTQEWEKLWIVWKTVRGPGPLEKKGLFGELWKDEDREGCQKYKQLQTLKELALLINTLGSRLWSHTTGSEEKSVSRTSKVTYRHFLNYNHEPNTPVMIYGRWNSLPNETTNA